MKLQIAEINENLVRPEVVFDKITKAIKDYLKQHKNLDESDYKLSHDNRFIILDIQGFLFRFLIDKVGTHKETKRTVLNARVLNDFNGNLTYFYDSVTNKHYLIYDGEKLFEINTVKSLNDNNSQSYNRTLYSDDLADLVTVGDKSFYDIMNVIKSK